MQVSVEKTSELSRRMTVSLPAELFQEKMATRLESLAREVRIDGFRPGKAPQHLIKKMYGDRIRTEVEGELIQSTYFEALQNQDLKPAGYPHIHETKVVDDGFKYIAEFEVYPEISLEGIEQLAITRLTANVEESDVDNMVEKLRVQKRDWQPVERASQSGDRITISFSGTAEGESFTNGQVNDYQVELGSKQMIPGFEDNLTGLNTGENKTFTLAFPEPYDVNPDLAGKAAEFEIEVTKIEEPVLPEVDSEFAKAYGIEDGNIESFREDIKANMERELNQALRGKLKNAAMDALYEKISFTLPNVLVDQEVENLLKPYKESAKKQKLKFEDLNLPKDMLEERAKRRVALGLILGEIIEKKSIKLDDGRVRETIEEMAQSYERPEDVLAWYYSDEERLDEVKQMVLEEQIVEWLVNQADVSDKQLSFSEAMENHGV